MNREPIDCVDPTQPALVVTYGTAARRHRPLDRGVVLIGQSRCCDLPLASPEIAEVHCLVVKTDDGWHVRDCGSRAGTRVNGRPVQDVRLDDGDVLQIGRFAFRAHLPGTFSPSETPAPQPSDDAEKWRRRLVSLALKLRRRLHQERRNRSQSENDTVSNGAQADLLRQAELLRQRLRACEQREIKLDEAERDLSDQVAAVERETEKTVERLKQAERELEERQAAFEAQSQAAPPSSPPANDGEVNRELEQLRALLEEKEIELVETRARVNSGTAQSTRENETFEAELNAYRQELEQERRRLEEEADQLQARREEIDELARTMELEMSRERARMAHERIEVNRMREEVRMDLDRLKRNDTVRERLAGLQRIKPA